MTHFILGTGLTVPYSRDLLEYVIENHDMNSLWNDDNSFYMTMDDLGDDFGLHVVRLPEDQGVIFFAPSEAQVFYDVDNEVVRETTPNVDETWVMASLPELLGVEPKFKKRLVVFA